MKKIFKLTKVSNSITNATMGKDNSDQKQITTTFLQEWCDIDKYVNKHINKALNTMISLPKLGINKYVEPQTLQALQALKKQYIETYMQMIDKEIIIAEQEIKDKKVVISKESKKYQHAKHYLEILLSNIEKEITKKTDKIASKKEITEVQTFITHTLLNKISKIIDQPKRIIKEQIKAIDAILSSN